MSNFRYSDRAEGAKKKEKTFDSLPKKRAFLGRRVWEWKTSDPFVRIFGIRKLTKPFQSLL